MSLPLKGVHLLITRPQAQGQLWAQQLQDLGALTTQQAMIEIQPLLQSANESALTTVLETTKQQTLKLDEYQKILFVSQNAVTHFMPWLDQYWPQLPIDLEFFAIGSSTGKLLQQSLVTLDAISGANTDSAMNSETLLELPALQDVAGEKIAIVRGVGGRTLLGDTLSTRGAHVESIAVYERAAPVINDWSAIDAFVEDESCDDKIIAALSGETLDNLCALTPSHILDKLKQLPLLVPGQRVCDYGQQSGFNTIITARNATHTSMIEAIYDWQK